MNKFRQLLEILVKAQGEGSKGGHVIGHTRSGKPIYSSAGHETHHAFGSQDHRDAMNHHYEIWSKTQNKIASIREKKPHWNPPKEVHEFLNHHYNQMKRHSAVASRHQDIETKQAKHLKEHSKEIKGPFPYHTVHNIHKSHDFKIPFHAVVVVVNPEKTKFLMGKRYKDKIWTAPAGGAHIGEFPKETAIREAFEESNIALKESQLVELPMQYNKHLRPVYAFLAILEEDQMKNVTTANDPDEEIKRWEWFNLADEMPEPMDENRMNTINSAKMHLKGMFIKSYLNMDPLEGMSSLSTSEFSEENSTQHPEKRKIELIMEDYKSGDSPRTIPMEQGTLNLVKIDEGMYSGFFKKINEDGLEENALSIDKMPIPSIIQLLLAKQLIREHIQIKESPELKFRELLQALMPKPEKMVYVSMDGDNIGNKVAQAEASDDEATLMEISRKIQAGQDVFHNWAQELGGKIIESGGDEGLSKIPESKLHLIDMFRRRYEEAVGATVTVGVGDAISHATKARELGKLKGKNRIETYDILTDEELKKLVKPKDPVQKLIDSGVLDLTKSLQNSLEFQKAKGLPVGSVRVWHGGMKYIKQGDGHWMPMPSGDSSDEVGKKPEVSQPSSTNQKKDTKISTDANSTAVSQPQGESIQEKPEPKPEPKKRGPKSVLDHLKPKQGTGGHVSIDSKTLKSALKKGPISIISAGRNPNHAEDKAKTDDQVKKRYKQLEEDLKDQGFKYVKVKGHYGGEEDSFMVFGGNEDQLNEIGKKYNQDSVIHSEAGNNKLHFTTGKDEGKHHKGQGYQEVPEAEDFYSVVDTSDGKKIKFSLGLDFGKLHGKNE